jgi:peroxiredoxin
MKKFLAALTVAAAFAVAPAMAEVTIGQPAPDHTFKDINGVEHSIAGFKGKTIVLEWTNPGCPFVQKFYKGGDMQKFQAETLVDTDVVWIAVNSSADGKEGSFATDEEAKKAVEAAGFKGTAYVRDPSGAFGKLYGAKTTPHMFVIDTKGNVAYAGAYDSIKSADGADIAKAENYVDSALNALAAGEMPETTSTEPYGCGVKYAD